MSHSTHYVNCGRRTAAAGPRTALGSPGALPPIHPQGFPSPIQSIIDRRRVPALPADVRYALRDKPLRTIAPGIDTPLIWCFFLTWRHTPFRCTALRSVAALPLAVKARPIPGTLDGRQISPPIPPGGGRGQKPRHRRAAHFAASQSRFLLLFIFLYSYCC